MIKAMLLGDSVAYGSMTTLPTRRLARHPEIILNERQSVFDFQVNHCIPGSSWAGLFSPSAMTRQDNGLPGGVELAQLLATTDCQAVLFALGGNDDATTAERQREMANRIREAARLCQVNGKLFAFMGVIDVSAVASWRHAPFGAGSVYELHLPQACRIAGAAEVLRQTCIAESYPYIDVRNRVDLGDWRNVTGDEIHPTPTYYEAIFSAVADEIGG